MSSDEEVSKTKTAKQIQTILSLISACVNEKTPDGHYGYEGALRGNTNARDVIATFRHSLDYVHKLAQDNTNDAVVSAISKIDVLARNDGELSKCKIKVNDKNVFKVRLPTIQEGLLLLKVVEEYIRVRVSESSMESSCFAPMSGLDSILLRQPSVGNQIGGYGTHKRMAISGMLPWFTKTYDSILADASCVVTGIQQAVKNNADFTASAYEIIIEKLVQNIFEAFERLSFYVNVVDGLCILIQSIGADNPRLLSEAQGTIRQACSFYDRSTRRATCFDLKQNMRNKIDGERLTPTDLFFVLSVAEHMFIVSLGKSILFDMIESPAVNIQIQDGISDIRDDINNNQTFDSSFYEDTAGGTLNRTLNRTIRDIQAMKDPSVPQEKKGVFHRIYDAMLTLSGRKSKPTNAGDSSIRTDKNTRENENVLDRLTSAQISDLIYSYENNVESLEEELKAYVQAHHSADNEAHRLQLLVKDKEFRLNTQKTRYENTIRELQENIDLLKQQRDERISETSSAETLRSLLTEANNREVGYQESIRKEQEKLTEVNAELRNSALSLEQNDVSIAKLKKEIDAIEQSKYQQIDMLINILSICLSKVKVSSSDDRSSQWAEEIKTMMESLKSGNPDLNLTVNTVKKAIEILFSRAEGLQSEISQMNSDKTLSMQQAEAENQRRFKDLQEGKDKIQQENNVLREKLKSESEAYKNKLDELMAGSAVDTVTQANLVSDANTERKKAEKRNEELSAKNTQLIIDLGNANAVNDDLRLQLEQITRESEKKDDDIKQLKDELLIARSRTDEIVPEYINRQSNKDVSFSSIDDTTKGADDSLYETTANEAAGIDNSSDTFDHSRDGQGGESSASKSPQNRSPLGKDNSNQGDASQASSSRGNTTSTSSTGGFYDDSEVSISEPLLAKNNLQKTPKTIMGLSPIADKNSSSISSSKSSPSPLKLSEFATLAIASGHSNPEPIDSPLADEDDDLEELENDTRSPEQKEKDAQEAKSIEDERDRKEAEMIEKNAHFDIFAYLNREPLSKRHSVLGPRGGETGGQEDTVEIGGGTDDDDDEDHDYDENNNSARNPQIRKRGASKMRIGDDDSQDNEGGITSISKKPSSKTPSKGKKKGETSEFSTPVGSVASVSKLPTPLLNNTTPKKPRTPLRVASTPVLVRSPSGKNSSSDTETTLLDVSVVDDKWEAPMDSDLASISTSLEILTNTNPEANEGKKISAKEYFETLYNANREYWHNTMEQIYSDIIDLTKLSDHFLGQKTNLRTLRTDSDLFRSLETHCSSILDAISAWFKTIVTAIDNDDAFSNAEKSVVLLEYLLPQINSLMHVLQSGLLLPRASTRKGFNHSAILVTLGTPPSLTAEGIEYKQSLMTVWGMIHKVATYENPYDHDVKYSKTKTSFDLLAALISAIFNTNVGKTTNGNAISGLNLISWAWSSDTRTKEARNVYQNKYIAIVGDNNPVYKSFNTCDRDVLGDVPNTTSIAKFTRAQRTNFREHLNYVTTMINNTKAAIAMFEKDFLKGIQDNALTLSPNKRQATILLKSALIGPRSAHVINERSTKSVEKLELMMKGKDTFGHLVNAMNISAGPNAISNPKRHSNSRKPSNQSAKSLFHDTQHDLPQSGSSSDGAFFFVDDSSSEEGRDQDECRDHWEKEGNENENDVESDHFSSETVSESKKSRNSTAMAGVGDRGYIPYPKIIDSVASDEWESYMQELRFIDSQEDAENFLNRLLSETDEGTLGSPSRDNVSEINQIIITKGFLSPVVETAIQRMQLH